jgi:hypothetical protein
MIRRRKGVLEMANRAEDRQGVDGGGEGGRANSEGLVGMYKEIVREFWEVVRCSQWTCGFNIAFFSRLYVHST